MILKQFVIGPLEVNNYLLIDEGTKEAVLIDCSEKNPEIERTLKEYGANLKYVLLTHGHFDHVLGVNNFKATYKAPVLMNNGDLSLLENINQFAMGFGFGAVEVQHVDDNVLDNQIIKFGNDIEIKVLHTPGHSLGSVCYLIGENLFTGDTVFLESVGRTDLPGGSFSQLKENIENKIFTLDENIKIYPGHGPSSTVGHEKRNNRFL